MSLNHLKSEIDSIPPIVFSWPFKKNEFSNAEIPCEMLILFKLMILAEIESM